MAKVPARGETRWVLGLEEPGEHRLELVPDAFAAAVGANRLEMTHGPDPEQAPSIGDVDLPGGTVLSTTEKRHFNSDEARAAGERIGIDWSTSRFDVEQFRMGMDVELEHGTHDLDTNVTNDDLEVTAKIARAHLNEFPDYYSRLAVMEADAEAYWEAHPE